MIAQLSRFLSVGALATLLHVIVAIIAANVFGVSALLANSAGFAAAVTLSYLGHGKFTFGTKLEHRFHASRFLTVSGFGLLLSTLLTEVIAVRIGAPFVVAMAVVACAVPVSTYLLCKYWVFARPHSSAP